MEKSFLRLSKPEARAAYVQSELSHGLAAQIRVLRTTKKWSQAELAAKLGTSQNAVCRLENPQYGRYSLKTLLALSKVFDVGLITRFVPFSKLMAVTWDTTQEALNVESYEEEAPRVVFYQLESSPMGFIDVKWTNESLSSPAPKIAVTTTKNSSTQYLPTLITESQNG